ncbi:MAG: hypothetical protein SFX73_23530 [Kofleriaceae bacterium]|nr:hypothetical protein [Kofleriaceae bacterium]
MTPFFKTMGALASRAWLEQQGLDTRSQAAWYVEVQVHSDLPNARFELNLYPEEWGFVFRLKAQLSWIRVTDLAFVHGADDLKLLGRTPRLDALAELMTWLEAEHALRFDRAHAIVRTNLDEGRTTAAVRAWLTSA